MKCKKINNEWGDLRLLCGKGELWQGYLKADFTEEEIGRISDELQEHEIKRKTLRKL